LHHGVVLRPDQIQRARQLDMGVSFTAAGLYPMGDALAKALGPQRQAWLGPIGSVQRAGIPVSLHHDVPFGVSPNLMDALWSAVTRTTRSGAVLQPQERITPYAGLLALTRDAAYQLFEEKTKGSLDVGKLADFVVLDANPLKVEPMAIRRIQVLSTIKQGQTVYRSGVWSGSGSAAGPRQVYPTRIRLVFQRPLPRVDQPTNAGKGISSMPAGSDTLVRNTGTNRPQHTTFQPWLWNQCRDR
jgi:hypothetical protein